MDRNDLIYNGLDCCITYEVASQTLAQTQKQGFQPTYDMTMRLYPPLMYMMTKGVRVDFDRLNQTKISVQRQIDEAQEELNKLAGRPLNANSPKQLREYFYVEKGVKPYVRNGSISTDDRAMQHLSKPTGQRPGFREASLIQRIRSLRKLKGTYLDIQFDSDGRLRCSYNARGTKFGRLSSSKTTTGTGMNMQNLPEEFQQFLIADPGYVMIDLDKAQAEWVVVAYDGGDEQMIKVIEEGLDPHAYTAHLMFGVDIPTIKAEAKAIGHSTDPDYIRAIREEQFPELLNLPFIIRNMSMRQAGKKSNHSLNYDESAVEFALQNEMLEADARKVWNLYHSAYPGVHRMHEKVKAKLSHDRTLENCFGRRIKLMDGWSRDLWKSAYSAIPQSTVVDLINQAMCDIYEDTRPGMREIELLMQVHDSIRFQYPLSQLHNLPWVLEECYRYLDPTMEYSGREFHIGTDMKLGFNGRDMVEVPFTPSQTSVEDLRSVIDELSGT